MTDLSRLNVEVDTKGVSKGITDLRGLGDAAERAEKGVDGLTDATKAAERAQASQAKSQASFLAALREQSDLYGKSRADVLAYQAAQLGVTQQAAPLIASIKAQTEATKQLGAGQKLTGSQYQQLGYQLNDFFVQVASGQSVLTAAIQQGSQLSGTFGGLLGPLRAIGSLFTVTRVLIGGVVGAVATLGYGFYQAEQQAEDFRKSILLTGNAAGITRGQFVQAANDIATSTKTSVGSTRETLQALVSSGQFTGTALTSAATAAQGFAKVTGESADKVIASFIKGASSVSTFAETLNQQYHFLSVSQRQSIKDAEDQGDSTRALTILFDALNGRIDEVGKSTNSLSRGFGALKSAAISLKDSFIGLFDDVTPEKRLADLRKQLADLQKPAPTGRSGVKLDDFFGGSGGRNASTTTTLQAAITAQEKLVKGAQDAAQAKAAGVESDKASGELAKRQDQFQTNAQKRAKELADLDAIYARSRKTQADADNLASAKAGVIDRYKDRKDTGAGKLRTDASAAAREALEDIKSAGQAQLDEYQSQDRVLEARRAALLIRDQAYYDEKLKIARNATRAQVATLEEENKFLNGRSLTGADASNRDRQVIANKTKIATLNAKLAETETINGIQSTRANEQVQQALDDARVAAQSYLDVQQRTYDLGILSLSLSDRQAQGLSAIAAIQDRYEQQRQSIQGDRRRGQISQDRADEELAVINEFEKKAIQSYNRFYDAQVAGAQDASLGMQKALANYLDDAQNAAKQSQELFTSAFTGLEDSLVTFATTGKLSFKSLADSIIADLARVAAKTAVSGLLKNTNLFSTLAGAANPEGGLTGFLSGLFGGGRASGGPVDAGRLYQVNERGPELLNVAGKQYLMMGGQSGSVTPNGGGAGAGKVNIVNNTQGRIDQAHVSRMDDGQMAIVLEQAEDRIIAGLRDPNGRAYGAVQTSFNVQPKR